MSFYISLSMSKELFFPTIIPQLSLIFGVVTFLFENFVDIPISMSYLAYVAIIFSAILILWTLFLQLKLLHRSARSSSEIVERSIYLCCLIFNIFGRYFVYFVTLASSNMSKGYIFSMFNCVDVVTVLIIVSISGRKLREDYFLSKVSVSILCPLI